MTSESMWFFVQSNQPCNNLNHYNYEAFSTPTNLNSNFYRHLMLYTENLIFFYQYKKWYRQTFLNSFKNALCPIFFYQCEKWYKQTFLTSLKNVLLDKLIVVYFKLMFQTKKKTGYQKANVYVYFPKCTIVFEKKFSHSISMNIFLKSSSIA